MPCEYEDLSNKENLVEKEINVSYELYIYIDICMVSYSLLRLFQIPSSVSEEICEEGGYLKKEVLLKKYK